MALGLTPGARILIAGVGNVLEADDGFGPAVIAALAGVKLPAGVTVMDAGTGGFSLVRELMEGYDALVIVDAIDRGLPPGTVCVLEPVVPDIAALPAPARAAAAGDMHQAVPGTALLIAKAAGALPPLVRIVGCQPQTLEPGLPALSRCVRRALPDAVNAVQTIVASALKRPQEAGQP